MRLTVLSLLALGMFGVSLARVEGQPNPGNDLASAEQIVERLAAPLDLWEAAEAGDIQRLTALIGQGAELDALDGSGMAPLHYSASEPGRAQHEASLLLLNAGANPNRQDRYQRTPLFFAARSGEAEQLELLLQRGANPTATVDRSPLPMIAAARSGNLEAIEILLREGADVDQPSGPNNQRPIIAALERDQLEAYRLLRSKSSRLRRVAGPPPMGFAVEPPSRWELSQAIDAGAERCVKYILGQGVEPTGRQLHGAVMDDRGHLALLVLDAGAEPNGFPGARDLLTATIKHHDPVLRQALIDHGVTTEPPKQSHWLPFYYGVHSRQIQGTRYLWEHGAEFTEYNEMSRYEDQLLADGNAEGFVLMNQMLRQSEGIGEAPGHRRENRIARAIAAGDAEAVRSEFEGGTVTDSFFMRNAPEAAYITGQFRLGRWIEKLSRDRARYVRTPASKRLTRDLLHEVERGGSALRIRALIEHGASIHIRGGYENEKNLMAFAIESPNSANLVPELIEAGVSPVDKCDPYDTPLSLAIKENRVQAAVALIEAGADPNDYKTSNSRHDPRSALGLPASEGNLQMVKALIEHGADPDLPPTPLVLAIERERAEVVDYLLDLGVDVNRPSSRVSERTALIVAAKHGDAELVKRLLDMGAEVNATGELQWTALSFAENYFRDESSELIRASGGRRGREPGPSPLVFRANDEAFAEAQSMLERGADPNAPTRSGIFMNSPLLRAIEGTGPRWGKKYVELLLEHGAEPTPQFVGKLVLRANGGQMDETYVHALLRRFVADQAFDPNEVFVLNGPSLLEYAVTQELTEIVRILLDGGADPMIANPLGGTPLDAAHKSGNERIQAMLREAQDRLQAENPPKQIEMTDFPAD